MQTAKSMHQKNNNYEYILVKDSKSVKKLQFSKKELDRKASRKSALVHYTLGLERWWKIITQPHRSHFEGGLICSIIGSKCVHKDSHINKSNYIITAFPIQLVFNSYSQAGGPFSTCVFSPPTLRAGRLLLLHGKTGGNFASLFSIPSINCSSCHTILWRLLILHLNNWACK